MKYIFLTIYICFAIILVCKLVRKIYEKIKVLNIFIKFKPHLFSLNKYSLMIKNKIFSYNKNFRIKQIGILLLILNVLGVIYLDGFLPKNLSFLLCVGSFEWLLIILANSFKKSKNKKDWPFIFYIFLIMVYLILIVISGQLADIDRPIHFAAVIILILLLFTPMFIFLINAINVMHNKKINLLLGISVLLIFEAYIFMLFGCYNFQQNMQQYNTLDISSEIEYIIKLIQIGSMHVYNFPDINDRVVYFIQFLIGNTYNMFVIGIFMSYFSNYISSDEN